MTPLKVRQYGKGTPKRILCVVPPHPESFWTMDGMVGLFGSKCLIPNAAFPLLMALTPKDVCVEYMLADENVSTLDWATPCDLVAITGNTLHAKRISELCQGFRKRGVPVALGGTYASLWADQCRDLADYLFIGEAEHTWPRFLLDWTNGTPQSVYHQDVHIDLKNTPAPDWSLIEINDYVNLSVQTSRGCPNQCDFCDVIQFVGRRYRTKSVEQIMTEVKAAHQAGARSVFFSDDNFLGNREFTGKLLPELIRWNAEQTRPLTFSTQITVQVADDEELLRQFADAKFSIFFLGVETPKKDCLEEIHKFHNLKRDLKERLHSITRHGIVPFIGLIVGFDHDDLDTFAIMEDFLNDTNCPVAGISLLNAPKNTPLYNRLKAEGRLINEQGLIGEWQMTTNVIPKQMSRETLIQRYWELYLDVYSPGKFAMRLERWLAEVEYFTDVYTKKKADWKQYFRIYRMLHYYLVKADSESRRHFLRNMRSTLKTNPKLLRRAIIMWAFYRHFRDFLIRNAPQN